MAIDKLIPQYLNKDEDARLIKNAEMSHALNVRVSSDDGGNQGVLKNVEGTKTIAARLPADAIPTSGSSRVIGSVASEAGKCIYYFLYNTAGSHGIYQYVYTLNMYYKVYENSVLNFDSLSTVNADVVINQFGEHLLYFTDDRNEPRKINATKALSGGYSSWMDTGTTAEKELFLTVCKQPPQTPITFEFLTEENNKSNKLKSNVFQFAYQYIYDDGEASALSVYSELAVSKTNLAYNSVSQDVFGNTNNAIKLTLTGTKAPVDKLRVFARRNNDQAFYKIGEVDNPGSYWPQSLIFRNDGVYNLLPDQDAFKMFDSVPRKAFSQAISNNRLFYGNYLEGFDNISTQGTHPYPIYYPRITTPDFPVSRGSVEPNLLNQTDYKNKYYRYQFGLNYGDAGNLPSTYENLVSSFESVTNGISIEINLLDAIGVSLNESNVEFNAIVSADEFSVGTTGASGMFFSSNVTTFDDDGSEIHSRECRFATPLDHGYDGNDELQYGHCFDQINTQSIGSINKLMLTSNLEFSSSFTIDAIESSGDFIQELADQFALGIIGTTATASIRPRIINDNPAILADSVLNIYNNSNDAGSNHTCRVFPTDGLQDMVTLWMEGDLSYTIYQADFFQDGNIPKLILKLKLTDLNLEAIKAAAVQFDGAILNYPFDLSAFGVDPGDSGQASQIDSVLCSLNSSLENSLGFNLKDEINWGTGNAVRSALTNYKTISSSLVLTDNTFGDQHFSFKAGATHPFGVVYFDHRNRPSGVQKIDNADVSHFGQADRLGNEGRSAIDIKLEHDPPSWATKWAPVYSKNTTYEKVLQVSIAEAGLAKKDSYTDPLSPIQAATASSVSDRPILEALEGGTQGVIFLSLRGLEGKTNSYNESKGANLSYEYMEGDMLRILQYESNNITIRPGLEFPITSYRKYVDNEENPIQIFGTSQGDNATQEDLYRRTGYFLTIRDEDITGFNRNSIAAQVDIFSADCIAEIYRPKKKQDDLVFYEVGKCYDIIEVSGQRTHAGDRSNSVSPSFNISTVSNNKFLSSQRLYLGDKVLTSAVAAGFVIISNIHPQQDGTYIYTIVSEQGFPDQQLGFGFPNNTIDTTVGSSYSIFPGAITLDVGDVCFRIRELLVNPRDEITLHPDKTLPSSQLYKTFLIEDESVSDFFESKAVSIGRPHIETPDQEQIRRFSSVTYSDVFALDNSVLNLSSFNPSLFPFKDYDTQHGGICYLMNRNESILVMQENKVSATPISRVLIESAEGGQLVTSQNVMGTPTYYAGDYGPGRQPEGIVERFGRVYFVDVSRAAVLQLDSNGLQPISSKHMDSYFQVTLGLIDSKSQTKKVPCGLDPDNDEYVMTTTIVTTKGVSLPAGDGGHVIDVQTPNISGTRYTDAIADIVYKPKGAPWWGEDPSRWEKDDSKWSDSGSGVVFIDRLGERGSVIVDSIFEDSTDVVNAKFFIYGGEFFGTGFLSTKDGTISLPGTVTRASDGGTVSLTKASSAAAASGETLAWSTTKQVWLTFYSFAPELYAHLHDRFFSFRGGQIWRHNILTTMNNFYGVQYNSEATVVSKGNPSMVKTYDAISYEGDNPWNAIVSNSDQATSSMASTEFTEKENMWYRVISKDETGNSILNTSHKIVLGQVTAIDGLKITFSSRISNLPFGIGDALFKLETSSSTDLSRTISSVSGRKEITTNTAVTGLVIGDTVMAVSNDEINGDNIRDYYAQIEMRNSSTSPIELYAVNMSYTPSNLHNEK